MSIINNAHPGSSIRLLCLIDRVLCRRKGRPISSSELVEMCRPSNLPNSPGAGARFESNLKFWINEKLWQEDGASISAINIDRTDLNPATRVLELLIRNVAEKNESNIRKGNSTEPFLRTISCLLSQDTYTFLGKQQLIPGTNGNVAEAVNAWLPNEMSINVSNEASTLLEYGDFLGFLEPLEKGFIVDPTRAIDPVLGKVFSGAKEMQVREFIACLAEHLPMLDGGKYREQIEPLMQEKGWQLPEPHQISASLSHALIRLSNDLRIILEHRSDDVGSMSLKVPGEIRFVSVIRYRGMNK